MKKKIIFGIIISLICIYFASRGINYNDVIKNIQSIRYLYAIPIVLIILLAHYLKCCRWGILLKPLVKYKLKTLISISSIGFMAVDILPARLGELIRPYLVKKKSRIRISSTLTTVIIEHIFDIFAVLLILLITLIKIPMHSEIFISGIIILILSLSIFFLFIFIASKKKSFKKANYFIRKIPDRYLKYFQRHSRNFINGLQIFSNFKKMVTIWILTLIIWGLYGLSAYILFFSFGFDLSIFHAYAIIVIIALGIIIPAAPGFIGNYHYACILVLTSFGILKGEAFSYAVVLHFFQFGPVVILGFIFLIIENFSFLNVIRENKEKM